MSGAHELLGDADGPGERAKGLVVNVEGDQPLGDARRLEVLHARRAARAGAVELGASQLRVEEQRVRVRVRVGIRAMVRARVRAVVTCA